MECADNVFLVSQALCVFAKFLFQLQVFLEVVFSCLVIQFEQVVELLNIELIVAPQFVGLLCRNSLNFFPLLLQFLKGLIRLVGFIWRCSHSFYLLYDFCFFLEVFLFFLFLFQKEFRPSFLYNAHLCFERVFNGVGRHLIGFRVAAILQICFLFGIAFGNVQFVECGFKVIYFLFVWCLVLGYNLCCTP